MQEVVLESGRVERQYWHDLWRYRELFFFLSWRNILIRYKQTVVGVAWSVIRPLLTIGVLTVVFSVLAKLPSEGVPYPILVFCGMLPWQFVAAALTESGNSLVANSNMISKVYFPRLIMPASSVMTTFIDFIISAALLAIVMVIYRYLPPLQILALPLFILLAFFTAFGSGLWIAALMVSYRDFKVIVPFIVQFGLYVSPVGFSSSIVPEKWMMLYSANPMVAVIDGFRWCILGGSHTIHIPGLVLSVGVVALINVIGLVYFRKTERTFADII